MWCNDSNRSPPPVTAPGCMISDGGATTAGCGNGTTTSTSCVTGLISNAAAATSRRTRPIGKPIATGTRTGRRPRRDGDARTYVLGPDTGSGPNTYVRASPSRRGRRPVRVPVAIGFPIGRVRRDVAAAAFEIRPVTHDVLVVVPLPQPAVVAPPSEIMHPGAVTGGGDRFESLHHIAQGRIVGWPLPAQVHDGVEVVRHHHKGIEQYPRKLGRHLAPDGDDHLSGGIVDHATVGDVSEEPFPVLGAQRDCVRSRRSVIPSRQSRMPPHRQVAPWHRRLDSRVADHLIGRSRRVRRSCVGPDPVVPVSYTHLRAHETDS